VCCLLPSPVLSGTVYLFTNATDTCEETAQRTLRGNVCLGILGSGVIVYSTSVTTSPEESSIIMEESCKSIRFRMFDDHNDENGPWTSLYLDCYSNSTSCVGTTDAEFYILSFPELDTCKPIDLKIGSTAYMSLFYYIQLNLFKFNLTTKSNSSGERFSRFKTMHILCRSFLLPYSFQLMEEKELL